MRGARVASCQGLAAWAAMAGGASRPVLSAAELLMGARHVLGAEATLPGSPRRDRGIVPRRDLVVLGEVERHRIAPRVLAEALGHRPDHVSRWIGRAGRRKGADDGFWDEITGLDATVAAATNPSPRLSGHARKTRCGRRRRRRFPQLQ